MEIINEIKKLSANKRELKKFALTIGLMLSILSIFFWYKENSTYYWYLLTGIVLILIGFIVPFLLKPFYYLWMSFAIILGFVMTRLILTVFYFLVITPVGLLMRSFGKDPLNRKIDKNSKTYWLKKEYLIKDRSRFEKYF